MADTQTPANDPTAAPGDNQTGVDRPDRKHAEGPATGSNAPATGGDGAAGAGGPDGFGTGS